MCNVRPSLAAAAIALACSAAPASAQFSNYFFFGDSSTDAGAFGARFTVNPGLVWAQDLGARYGAAITTSVTGGTDYAQGGARVAVAPSAGSPLTLVQQVDQQLAKTPTLDGRALYAVSIGYNDLFNAVGQASTGQITAEQAQANVAQAAQDAAAQVARLRAAGARYIVVLNLYDTGKSPGGAVSPSTFSGLTTVYNTTLATALAQTGANIISVNTNALFLEMIADPGAFGFTNVTSPACTTASSLQCTSATLVAPNAAQTYLFADSIHPTPVAHAVMAQVVASMIEGPMRMSALAQAPLAVEEANFRALDGRMQSNLYAPRPVSKLEMWGAYDYANNDIDGPFLSGNADQNTFTVGGDVKLSPHLLFGGMLGYSENRGDFGNGAGGYKLRETAWTVYGGWGDGPWYAGATLGGGDLEYANVHRNIQLGALTRTERGQTRGWHVYGNLLGGYWFTASPDWQHGPFGRLTYQDVHVDGFSETSSDSTALAYGDQTRTSLVTSLGWQIAGRLGVVRPFARATWQYEWRNDATTVTAAPATMETRYTVDGIRPDDNFFRFAVGASADIGKVTGYVSGMATAGNGNGNGYAITVGLRVPM
jgi:outer membrane lipase/esterase